MTKNKFRMNFRRERTIWKILSTGEKTIINLVIYYRLHRSRKQPCPILYHKLWEFYVVDIQITKLYSFFLKKKKLNFYLFHSSISISNYGLFLMLVGAVANSLPRSLVALRPVLTSLKPNFELTYKVSKTFYQTS